MNFQEINDKIEHAPNKKIFSKGLGQLSWGTDSYKIKSALYSDSIILDEINSVNDIYDVVKTYNLSEKPFYLDVKLSEVSDKTINIINELDSNFLIHIILDDIDTEKLESILKINHENSCFCVNGTIPEDFIDELSKRFNIDSKSNPLINIDTINSKTIYNINNLYQKIENPKFGFDIKDFSSLQNLPVILPYVPQDEIFVHLDKDIFNEKNFNNIRGLMIENRSEEISTDKKLNIIFKDITYDNIGQVYDLEKNIELIKSHIPSDASELDIVTYISLFMVNYFKYDEELAKNNDEDINIGQFISKGEGVCRHFASLTKYLLDSLNVECEYLTSFGKTEDDGHAFNIVKINDKMYFLDNTWLALNMQQNIINSLEESTDFLRSNKNFEHDEYEDTLNKYRCEDYDRDEIRKSVDRVLSWNSNYQIHPTALRDLFRKHILKKEKSIDEKINDAIPRRR